MQSEEERPELSETASALLEAWLASRAVRKPDAREPLAEEKLVQYLAGLLPETEAARLEERLVVDAAGRRALVQVNRRLQELRQRAWSEVLELAEAPDPVARAWCRQVAAWAQAAGRARSAWLAEGWEAVKRLSADHAALDAALAGCREALLGSLQRPLEPALVRGIDPAPENAPSMHPASAEITAEGALHVRAYPVGEPEPSTHYLLELCADPGPWPLAEAKLREGQVEWHVEGFGTLLGLAPVPLPVERFAVRPAESAAAVPFAPTVGRIRLRVEGPPEVTALVTTRVLELVGPLIGTNGELIIPLRFPPELAELPGAWRLALYVRVGAQHEQFMAELRFDNRREPTWFAHMQTPVSPDELLPLGLIAVLRADPDAAP